MKKFFHINFLISLILLASCASSKQTYLPDGSVGHSISCDGSAVGMNVCYEKAGELCGSRGYKLVNKEGQVIYSGVATQEFAEFGAFNTKSILVKCN